MTGGYFLPTRASVVEALRSGDADERERALGTLVAARMGKFYFELVTGCVTERYGKGGAAGNPERCAA
jgi:hypothetical protein